MTQKVKSVNGYIKKNGGTIICIKLENGDVCFVNEGLLAYACKTAKPIKEKSNKEAK